MEMIESRLLQGLGLEIISAPSQIHAALALTTSRLAWPGLF